MTITGEPPVKLIQPNWRALSGPEIHAALSGQRLWIDEDYEVSPGLKPCVSFAGGRPPIEYFQADGRWTSHFAFRGPRTFTGRWTVEPFAGGEHLCVEAVDFPRVCRFVWQGRMPTRLFMPATVSSHRTEPDRRDPDQVFNPYILTPIDEVR